MHDSSNLTIAALVHIVVAQLHSAGPPCSPPQVSARAKKRGLPQMGTLGAGNHYAEIQVGAPGRAFGIGTVICWLGSRCAALHQCHRTLLSTLPVCPGRPSSALPLHGDTRPTARLPNPPPAPCPIPIRDLAQVVDEVFDRVAARKMGIDQVGQVCIMIHSGSRGLGHQVRRREGRGVEVGARPERLLEHSSAAVCMFVWGSRRDCAPMHHHSCWPTCLSTCTCLPYLPR